MDTNSFSILPTSASCFYAVQIARADSIRDHPAKTGSDAR
jgi:hypothetical protein